ILVARVRNVRSRSRANIDRPSQRGPRCTRSARIPMDVRKEVVRTLIASATYGEMEKMVSSIKRRNGIAIEALRGRSATLENPEETKAGRAGRGQKARAATEPQSLGITVFHFVRCQIAAHNKRGAAQPLLHIANALEQAETFKC